MDINPLIKKLKEKFKSFLRPRNKEKRREEGRNEKRKAGGREGRRERGRKEGRKPKHNTLNPIICIKAVLKG
jgi:hypothetical protein